MKPDHRIAEVLNPHQWRIAWGIGAQVVFISYLVMLVLPVVVIVCTLPLGRIPTSVMTIASISLLSALLTPIMVSLFVPHVIKCVGSKRMQVYSLSKICLFSMDLTEVSGLERITFCEYIRMRVRGWPTDWSRAVGIYLKDSSCVVVSVVDPEAFISYIKSL